MLAADTVINFTGNETCVDMSGATCGETVATNHGAFWYRWRVRNCREGAAPAWLLV
jgi:hypothetical protein